MSELLATVYLIHHFMESSMTLVEMVLALNPLELLGLGALVGSSIAIAVQMLNKFRK